jgi:hypothetical protein
MQAMHMPERGCSDTGEDENNPSLLMEDIMMFILQTPVYTRLTYGPVFTSVLGEKVSSS